MLLLVGLGNPGAGYQGHRHNIGFMAVDAVEFYKVPLKDVVVIYDELDLAPGKVRAKAGGGNAGHNGLRSISAHVGNDYRRVRLGIGHPGIKDIVHMYVLHDFAKSERSE